MKNKLLLLPLIGLILMSCKFEFEPNDLRFYNNYQVNQLLVFASSTQEIDSFRITHKYTYYSDWAPFERDGKYNPPKAKILYEKCHSNAYKTLNLNEKNYTDAPLFTLNKSKPDNPAVAVSFSFQNVFETFGSDMKTVAQEQLVYREKPISCYVFTETPTLPTDIQKIYLDTNLQIIKYVYANGTVWNRTN
jgi:hypothetical protein